MSERVNGIMFSLSRTRLDRVTTRPRIHRLLCSWASTGGLPKVPPMGWKREQDVLDSRAAAAVVELLPVFSSLWGRPVECGPTGEGWWWWMLVDREQKQGCPLKRDPRFAPGPIDAWAHMLVIPAADLTSLRPQVSLNESCSSQQWSDATTRSCLMSRLHPGPGRDPSPNRPRHARYDPMWLGSGFRRGWKRGKNKDRFFVFQGCRPEALVLP